MTVPTGAGGVAKNPACTVSADAWNKVRQYANDLGLTYLSRQRLESRAVESEDEKAAKYLA